MFIDPVVDWRPGHKCLKTIGYVFFTKFQRHLQTARSRPRDYHRRCRSLRAWPARRLHQQDDSCWPQPADGFLGVRPVHDVTSPSLTFIARARYKETVGALANPTGDCPRERIQFPTHIACVPDAAPVLDRARRMRVACDVRLRGVVVPVGY